MKTMLRRAVTLVLCAALLGGAVTAFASCAKATPIATLDDKTITVNMYQFFLSRLKGKLGRAGYSVESADFWNTVIDKNNTTYGEYFRQTALSDTRFYLAALALFEEKGLSLPDSEYALIDEEIAEFVETAGSKSALNAELAAYGVNAKILREIYVIEAKVNYVQEHIYGKDGDKVGANLRLDYLKDNAVAFRHVLIRNFDYVYKTDENGDDIYYLVSQNNAKVNNIAYDKEAGNVRLNGEGEVIKDANGDTVYYLANGHIAYDTVNGERAFVYDSEGIVQTQKLSAEELAENKAAAEEIMATVKTGDYDAFESLLDEYAIDDEDFFETTGKLSFLYTTGDNTSDYLNDIADVLALANVGEVCNVYVSDYGYNVVMKYPIPDDAVLNSDYAEWFEGLADRVAVTLFNEMCEPYTEKVKVDENAFASLPDMTEIGTNYYY